jgi:hypothetical protein
MARITEEGSVLIWTRQGRGVLIHPKKEGIQKKNIK